MKRSKVRIRNVIGVLLLLLLVIFLFRSCQAFGYDSEFTYTSPQGTNVIIVKYDFVSRPSVFKRGLLWDKKLWEYPSPGFTETVVFGVEWISEDQIRFTYDDSCDSYDEEYIITIPD